MTIGTSPNDLDAALAVGAVERGTRISGRISYGQVVSDNGNVLGITSEVNAGLVRGSRSSSPESADQNRIAIDDKTHVTEAR